MFWVVVVGIGVVAGALLLQLKNRDARTWDTRADSGSANAAVAADDVEGLIRAGRKIDAIKAYREQHGVGLREAKEAVEDLARRLE